MFWFEKSFKTKKKVGNKLERCFRKNIYLEDSLIFYTLIINTKQVKIQAEIFENFPRKSIAIYGIYNKMKMKIWFNN